MARQALAALGTSIFSEMTRLAQTHGAVNLSQGFPDFDGPDALKEAAVAAVRGGHNQYGRSAGLPALVDAIAAHQQRHYGIALDPLTEVCALAGATEGIAAAMLGLLEPGDEVVLFEPFYDAYPAAIAMAGAVARVVTLGFPDFAPDLDALAAVVNDKTRMLVLNSPHNPTGKVFSRGELEGIARVCASRDIVFLCDEVYEHLTYDGVRHVPMASLPGMRDRTVTLSSSGKTYSVTGWKVGWATGPRQLIAGVQAAHQFLTFCAATPLHTAMATQLAGDDAPYLAQLRQDYTARRDFIVTTLRAVGFSVAVPQGTYFVLASLDGVTDEDDATFARRLVTEAGVAAIPPSAFYARDVAAGRRLLRFAFCKKQDTLERAAERLHEWHRRR